MRRLFWIAVGAGTAVYVVNRLNRTVRRLQPDHVARSIGGSLTDLADSLRDLVDEVRAEAAVREAELVQALGLDTDPAGGPAPGSTTTTHHAAMPAPRTGPTRAPRRNHPTGRATHHGKDHH
ncbi:DUF6167 family protein [Allostreptomyces psammosilenae]|uniref:Secreted protein n=1 Tax=Allostreptomyces psammosilenae TaxID=1892865 RepID=A0A853A2M6_9ACTN|nr:DUF6167 family protein [Allostreptomyces psammosilenae]NYI05001.1 hypothetical protein [Allostreptomyces psammosilenae]